MSNSSYLAHPPGRFLVLERLRDFVQTLEFDFRRFPLHADREHWFFSEPAAILDIRDVNAISRGTANLHIGFQSTSSLVYYSRASTWASVLPVNGPYGLFRTSR